MINAVLCEGEMPRYIFYASDIPRYIYYIFLPSIIITFLLGIFVFLKDKKNISSRTFFVLTLVMVAWMISMLGNWAQNDSGLAIFFDALNVLVGVVPAIFIYFILVYFHKKVPSFLLTFLIFSPTLPLFVLMSTSYNISEIDLGWCDTSVGRLYWYLTFLLLTYSIIALVLLIKNTISEKNTEIRKQTLIVLSGFIIWTVLSVILGVFLSVLGYTHSTLWAPISCTLFTAFITWSIVKYRFLDIKLLAAQALVAALVILVGSQFFYVQSLTSRVLTGITLVLAIGFGWALIKSVKNEVKRKEELQLMSDKLAQANDQLRKLDNAKSEFISIASHQLRTPLTAVKGFVSLLLEGTYGDVSTTQREALNKVYLSCERLIQLVENLLNVSRIESGRIEYEFRKWKIEDIIKEISDSLVFAARNKGLYLNIDLPHEGLPEIEADGAKLKEVVSNLVDNAVKYTRRGGVTVKAELSQFPISNSQFPTKSQISNSEIQNTGDCIRITVSDTGIGVPEADLPYLFSKFSRGKDTGRLHVTGTGLGLYVGKSIVNAHHGRIWVESDGENKGSRFIVELPLSQEKFRRQKG